MEQQHHHHHHHHHKDSASIFKERSLRAIRYRRIFEKYLKIATVILAIIMVGLVFFAYTFG
jgi:hypothetical protein